MKRLSSKRRKISVADKNAEASVGRILEMRPTRGRSYSPFAILMLFVAVAGITVAVLSFKRMSAAIGYADQAKSQLAAAQSRAADLENKVTDLQTLQTLSSKKMELPIVFPDKAWLTHSSNKLTLQYPNGFEVVEKSIMLTVKNDKGRIEIFRMKDYGDRPWGFEDEPFTQEDFDGYVPKEMLLVGTALEDSRIQPYDAWLYYGAGDEVTKLTLEAIAASVTALK